MDGWTGKIVDGAGGGGLTLIGVVCRGCVNRRVGVSSEWMIGGMF